VISVLKVPKHEILDPFVLPPFNGIWEGYSVCKRIYSNSLLLPRYSIFSKILISWTYAYNLYTYIEHTLTNFLRMVSIRLQIVCVCSAYVYKKTHINHIHRSYTYAEHAFTNCMRMLSIRVAICNGGKTLGSKISCLGTQCMCTIRKSVLSISIWHPKYTEHTPRKFSHISNPKRMKNNESPKKRF